MTTTATAPATASTTGHRAFTVLGAGIAATGGWAVLRQVGGVDLAVATPAGPSTVELPAVLLTTLVVGLAGWLLLAGLERWTRRPHRSWRVLAWGVLAVSLLGPLTTALTWPATGGLITLHVAVGAALLALPRTGRC